MRHPRRFLVGVAAVLGGIVSWVVAGLLVSWLVAGGWPWLLFLALAILLIHWLRRRLGFPERARRALEQSLAGEGRRVWLVSARRRHGVWDLCFRLRDPLQIADLLRRQAAFGPALGASVSLWPDRRWRQPVLRMRASTVRLPGPRDPFEVGELSGPVRLVTPPVTYQGFYGRYQAPKGVLVSGIGYSTRGPLWTDLASLPHLLIGGQTGTGKSAFLRQLLVRLLTTYGPERIQLLLIDLKGGAEFQVFAGLPHLPAPVVGQVGECAHAIAQLVGALQERLEVFRRRGVQSLEELERSGLRLPRIVVAIDEVTSLAYREIQRVAPEEAALRYAALDGLSTLARLGRAAGIHLLVATQRPDPEVLPGQLLANVGASIAFGVRNYRDSETILREGDASAAFLPRVAGRGVYVFGMEREEFQTPFLSGEEARRRLEERWPELRAPAVVGEGQR